MSVYLIDIHHHTHTCPADPEPHPFDTRQQTVSITVGGPCRTPITVHSGHATTIVDCGRHEPAHRQCGNCRTITWVRHTTVTFHGYHGPAHRNPLHQVGAAA
jgi:hypothetical protein